MAEHEDIQAMAHKYMRLACIPFIMIAGGLLAGNIMPIEFPWAARYIAQGCWIGGMIAHCCMSPLRTSAMNKIRGESATVFAELCARQRASNPNVILEVKTDAQIRRAMAGASMGHELYNQKYWVDVSMAGALAMGFAGSPQQQFAGMQPGVFPNAQQHVLAGLQQQAAFAGMQQPSFPQQAGFPQQPGFPQQGLPGTNPLLGAGGGMEMSNFNA